MKCYGICPHTCECYKPIGCSFVPTEKEPLRPCEKMCFKCDRLKEVVDGHPKCGRNWKLYFWAVKK